MNAAMKKVWPDAEIFNCEHHRLETLRSWLHKGMAFQSSSRRQSVAKAGTKKTEEFSAAAIRDEQTWDRLLNETYDIVEGTFRRYMTTHSAGFVDHIRRRPSPHEIATTKPVATGALEDKLDVLRARIGWRSHVFHNRERLNQLLFLIQLDFDSQDNEREYNKIIRQWLEANGGRPAVPRRAVV